MNCVSSATFQVLWNGTKTNEFRSARGLRQDDPLSPYLFVLCMERLGHWIVDAADNREWRPLFLSKGSPTLLHLFFAEYLMLFGEADPQQIDVIKNILNTFFHFSRQKVNMNKSQVFFSPNVPDIVASHVCRKVSFGRVEDLGMYLGLPILPKRVGVGNFEFLVNNVRSRLNGWEAKKLSLAGRIMLAKSFFALYPQLFYVYSLDYHNCV